MNKNSKKMLIVYPNTANKYAITLAVPILGGIARNHGWQINYFDTANYLKRQDSIEEKEVTGGFRPGLTKLKTKMLDYAQLVPDLQSLIDRIKPDLLCFTVMSFEFEYLMKFYPGIRVPENTLVCIGGIHAIICPDEIVNTGLFDIVCTGQGEGVFDEILSRYENGSRMDNIEGTYFRERKTGHITRNARRRLLAPEELWGNVPEYSFLSEKYFQHPFDEQQINIFWMEVARGCPYNCKYCGNSVLKNIYKDLGQYICTRPMDSIFNIFKLMTDKYKIDVFNFTDECFLAHPTQWLKEFAQRYALEVRKPFLIQTRSETVTEDRILILKSFKAPFFQIGIGVESGSERILSDVCNRKTKIDDIIRAYDLLHKHGVRTNAYFMVGFPTETREDIFKTIDLCRRIKADINVVSIFQPLPGLELTEFCIKEGYITGKEPSETFTSTSVLKMPQLSAEEIGNLRRTFLLYAKLPKEYYPDIEKCERDYEGNKGLFDKLVALRWEYDKQYKRVNFKELWDKEAGRQ